MSVEFGGHMMSNHDHRVPVKSGDKVARACPDNELRMPKKRFAETFSAEEVLLKVFFPTN
jgi:hypothetical protein